MALLGVLLAVGIYLISRIADTAKEKQASELALSKIEYAWFIKPAPTPGEEFSKTSRWEVSLMVTNEGPKTADTLILHLRTPPPTEFLHSEPTVMSDAAAADVEIRNRIPGGIYQIVYNHLTPGDSTWVHMFYSVPDAERASYMQAWRSGMFTKEFAKKFVREFSFTGEHTQVSNVGALDFAPSL